ncbi:hypothetical protein ACFQY7_29345 [Actinomadura luteofluorescens]|uniref:hypothetical protein n=1 Tax=Actinomadura luteofluorescens TaxID=46163 RepID=UPI00363D9E45
MVALTAAGAVLSLLAVPATSADAEPSVRRELRTMGRPRLWVVYAATILSTAAYMISFNYLAAFLTDVTGVPGVWVPRSSRCSASAPSSGCPSGAGSPTGGPRTRSWRGRWG